MASTQSGDFLIPSFHGNNGFSTHNYSRFNDTCDHLSRVAERAVPLSNINRNTSNPNPLRLSQNGKAKQIIRIALKSKNINGSGSVKNSDNDQCSENDFTSSASLNSTLSHFEGEENYEQTLRNEMYANDHVIDSLREKYVCLNFEFNRLQERHDDNEAIQSDSRENVLERKHTQVFQKNQTLDLQPSKIKNQSKKNKYRRIEENQSEGKENISNAQENNKELKMILKTLKNIFKTQPVASKDTGELRKLYDIVKTLQEEQEKFRTLIKEQQDQLNNFHTKYVQAQNLIQSQKYDIKQLHSINSQLEAELNVNMNALKEQFTNKINEFSHLPRAAKSEKDKADKLSKENCSLIAKLQQVKQELAEARVKLEEAGQKRVNTLNKLKTSERDLKIFRNQNNILRTEKRSLFEELSKLKGLNNDLKTTSSKNISRQKERGEALQRLLRKKIIDLEIELNQSKTSTNVLVEERDKLIAELNMQLNTLVHNFEVSKNHIRILRRHIYSLSGGQNVPLKVT